MQSTRYIFFLLSLFVLSHCAQAPSQQVSHKEGDAPLFEKVLEETKAELNVEMQQEMEVPIPKDMAGGYTHERHKRNWFMMQKAGALFQLTGEEKYAVYVRDMLLAYAKIYPTLPLHPTNRSYATGKIFWQCLNDANWLVYVSQAYDDIYDWLQPSERETLETELFRPYADFLSIDNPQFFNRIHNHSTWANAAVGMIGLVMKDDELVERALHGLKADQIPADLRDDDNGLIKISGQTQAGFLAQLDYSFSPDGYFTEGPYYLRYALSPFLQFAKVLADKRPDLNILSYRDSILQKAVYSLINQADFQGNFFPLNDAQKGMSWHAREVVAAVDLGYYYYGRDPMLLAIAEKQDNVILDDAGLAVAQDLAKSSVPPFRRKSVAYTDGPNGDKGGVGILRASQQEDQEICLVMKYSAQGMGHGHFDKLSYSMYDETGEVIQDYGAARWVNIDQKGGGRYLPENNSWAKQSIAHNTLVINEQSHFGGEIAKGEEHQPELYYFDAANENLQVVSAIDRHAYPGYLMQRTMLLMKDEAFRQPLLIDVMRAEGEQAAQFDLPTWFQGHLLSANFAYQTQTSALKPLGESHGYQHIWKEAQGRTDQGQAQVCWFSNGKLYTQTALVDAKDDLIFARSGANDQNFNLRHDPSFVIRKKGAKNPLFIALTETHGSYHPVDETPLRPFTSIDKLEVLHSDAAYTIFNFRNIEGKSWTIMLAHRDAANSSEHQVRAGQKKYTWKGPVHLSME